MLRILLNLVFPLMLFSSSLNTGANISTVNLKDDKVLLGLDNGSVMLYDSSLKTMLLNFSLEKIQNYHSKDVFASVYSLDYLNSAILVLSEGDFGSKILSIYKDKHLKSKKLPFDSAKKAFFIDDKTILLVLFSAEIKLIDFDSLKVLKDFSFSHYSLNDAMLNEDKTKLVAGFESGVLELFDIKSWRFIKSYEAHKDNIYQLSYKNNTLLSCSTDKNIALIQDDKIRHIRENFLIYSCALSPSAKVAAYANSDNNTITIFDTQNLKSIKKIQNKNKTMVEYIIFLSDKSLIYAAYDDTINLEFIE